MGVGLHKCYGSADHGELAGAEQDGVPTPAESEPPRAVYSMLADGTFLR